MNANHVPVLDVHRGVRSQLTRMRNIVLECALCGRQVKLTFHHLIPVAVHRKKRYLARFGIEEMRTRGLMICQLCHSGIHDLFPDEKILADHFNTQQSLECEPRMAKHIAWVKKQKET